MKASLPLDAVLRLYKEGKRPFRKYVVSPASALRIVTLRCTARAIIQEVKTKLTLFQQFMTSERREGRRQAKPEYVMTMYPFALFGSSCE